LAGPETLEVRAAPGASVGGWIVGSGLLWWFDPFFGLFGNEGWASRAGNGTSGARRPFDFLSDDRSAAVRRICLDEFQDWYADAAQARAASASEGDAVRWASEPTRDEIHALAERLADRVARELSPLSGVDGSLDAFLDSWLSSASIGKYEALASRLASASQVWEASGAAMALLAGNGPWGATPLPAATDDLPDPAAGASSSGGGGPASPNLQSPASDLQSPTSDLSAGVMALLDSGGSNQAPVAVEDSGATSEDTAITVSVLANDSDPDSNHFFITGVTQPANGVVTFTASTVTYKPDLDFSTSGSPEQFTYTITDGHFDDQGELGEATATVSITVNAVDDSPRAGYDYAQTSQSSPVVISVLANDYDPEGGVSVVGVDSWTSLAARGTNNGDGTVTYDPRIEGSGGWGPGTPGRDEFYYWISDATSHQSLGMAYVYVPDDQADDWPWAVGDAVAVEEDEPV